MKATNNNTKKFKTPNDKGNLKGMDMKDGCPINNMPQKVAGIKAMSKGKTGNWDYC